MTNAKLTKRALVSSIISLVLCVSMFVGTTFAWFTDSVTSANNIITAGNLDVELYYQVEGQTGWSKVTNTTNVFQVNALWEPGHTEVVKFKVVNEGSLSFKYNLGVNVAEEVGGKNVNGDLFKLSDFIKYAVVDGEKDYATRDEAINAVDTEATKLNVSFNTNGALLAGEEAVVTMVVYMPTTVGNEANYTGTDIPTIHLGVNLFATQYMNEEDSFGDDYDKGAPWTGEIDTDWYFENPTATEFTLKSGAELAGLAAIVNGTATAPVSTYATTSTTTVQDTFQGKTVKLGANVDLRSLSWTPIGRIGTSSTDFTYSFKGVFDGQGYTVAGLDVNAYGWAGLFGIAHHAEINNLKVDGVSIRANRMAGAIVGQLYGSIDNCHVSNANILVTPNLVDGAYDNGDKVGGIVGWLGDNNENRNLTNCTASNVEIGAYRDVGGIAGYVASSTDVSGNQVDNIEIVVDQITFYYGDKAFNAGAIYGRNAGVVDSNNTQGENIEITTTFAKAGATYKQDGVTGETVLYLVPADYEGTVVNVAEGTTTIGGYAFAYNKDVEKIVLPTTVTKLNDRAFRDTTASTVVLNEGLTNISYQAFRNATNVKEVVIPSTVTTISKEAFQNSGITTLTIPATVTTLEYGGCRDMKMLTEVTIEGNVEIPVYAFRACTNLKTVKLNGDNVTFAGRGMIFTNSENGDGSAITVYVANETVKERLLANDTAAKDYGGYTIHVATAVNNAEDLQNAINSATANETLVLSLGSGNFVLPTSAQGKKMLIVGNGDTVIATNTSGSYEGCNYSLQGSTVVFENVTITTDNNTYTGYAGCDATFNNCVINNCITLYGNTEFNNCTFNISGDQYNIWTWAAPKATFNNCTFNSDGKAILLYGGANTNLTLNDCTFNDNGGLSDKKAAVEIGNDYGASYTLTVNNTIVNGYEINDKGIYTGTTLWGNKNSMGQDKLNVVVDGVDVY